MRTARTAACLTWEAPSVGVYWRPLLSVVIVTHLVTRSLASRCPERLLKRLSGGSPRRLALQLTVKQTCQWLTVFRSLHSSDRAHNGHEPWFRSELPTSMRTTGAYEGWTTSASGSWCLWSRMRAVTRPLLYFIFLRQIGTSIGVSLGVVFSDLHPLSAV